MAKVTIQNTTSADLILAGVRIPAKTAKGHGTAEIEDSVLEEARAKSPVIESWFTSSKLIAPTKAGTRSSDSSPSSTSKKTAQPEPKT